MVARRSRSRKRAVTVAAKPAPMPREAAEIPALAALRLAHRFHLSLAAASAIAEANAWGCQ